MGVEWVSEGLQGELRKEARRVFVLPLTLVSKRNERRMPLKCDPAVI